MQRSGLERALIGLESLVNRESPYNPFYHLGAIGILLLWVILFTGIYLFIFYEISVEGAYRSVEYLTKEQWWLGGIMRSLHRYASDGLVLVALLHALRVFILKRYRFWRAFVWVTGVVTLGLVLVGGIFGYLMVWDMKAQFIAFLSARLLESLPVFGIPVGLNFAVERLLSDQFFYIVLFIHFSSIVVVALLLGLHLDRISRAEINPPKPITVGVLAILLVLSLVLPAVSDRPADIGELPTNISLDLFYMFVYPLFNYLSEPMLWALMVATTLLLMAIPWIGRGKRAEPAKVIEGFCVGCELCMKDCPYTAIQMKQKGDMAVAVVSARRCASCGICMGACEYSAIELGALKEDTLYDRIEQACEGLRQSGGTGVVVFACRWGADAKALLKGRQGVALVELECVGMVQPRMVEMALSGADGVVIAGCITDDCAYRRGNTYLEGRLEGKRPPVVRLSEEQKGRVGRLWFSATEQEGFLKGFEDFLKTLEGRKEAEKGEPV